MRYLIEGTDTIFNDYNDAIDYCIDGDYHDRYDDYFEEWVNDNYDCVNIAGTTYYPYDILDRFGDLEYVEETYQESQDDNDRDEADYELRHAGAGNEIYLQGKTIIVLEDEDEDEDHENEEDYLEATRRYYDEQTCLLKQKQEEQEKEETDLMKMFQVING